MTNINYMNAINEAKGLLSALLSDPDHGKLTFRGLHGQEDLTITSPHELERLISGTVLAIDGAEWMLLAWGDLGERQWQGHFGSSRLTSEALYALALEDADNLALCHRGL